MNAFRDDIIQYLKSRVPLGDAELQRAIEIPPSVELGDYAFPCFPLAKTLRQAPQAIAAELAAAFQPTALVKDARAAGPYVNFFVDRIAYSRASLCAIIEQGSGYGRSAEGIGKTVVIDYSSPNIAKPFGVGHLRSTVIGNALYRVYDHLGYQVMRINHLGDWGTQFGKLIVAFNRWGNDADLTAHAIQTLYDLYVRFHVEVESHPELEDEARSWFKRLEDGDPAARAIWQRFRDLSLQEFSRIYKRLGISFDSQAGESFYEPYLEPTIERIRRAGLVRVSDQALIVDLQGYNMPPCLLRKKDEATLYATRDLAAAMYRHDTYNFWKMLYVVGADQRLHFQQVFKVLELMSFPWAKDCVHVDFGLIRFNDEKMGTRRGNIHLSGRCAGSRRGVGSADCARKKSCVAQPTRGGGGGRDWCRHLHRLEHAARQRCQLRVGENTHLRRRNRAIRAIHPRPCIQRSPQGGSAGARRCRLPSVSARRHIWSGSPSCQLPRRPEPGR